MNYTTPQKNVRTSAVGIRINPQEAEVEIMNIIKLILGAIALVFVGMLLLWVLGWVGSLLWYVFWIGLFGAVGYGAYKLFIKAESKALGSDPRTGLGPMDVNMSWDEYDKKYLHK